jgi:hypothetical protein
MSFTKKRLIDYHYFMSQRKKYSNIFHSLRQNKSTKIVGIINRYHKKPKSYINKVAYLAGLIDGEAYFKTEKQGTLRLAIGMCDRKTIGWVYKTFGGNISLQKTAKGRNFYVWRMNQGKELTYLLLLLIPFLVNKRKIAVKFFKILLKKLEKMQHVLYPHVLGINKED